MSEVCPRLVLALLMFAPLAFGATDVWGITLVETGAFSALAIASIVALRGGEPLRKPPGMIPAMVLLLYGFVQCLPLPPVLLEFLSPAAAEFYRHSVWVLDPGVWMPLSVHAEQTLAQALRFGGYVGFYLVCSHVMSDRGRRDGLIHILAGFLGLYALVSIFQYILPSEKAFWILRAWPEVTPHRFGTYVNGNHYAGLMEMALPLLLALFLINRPAVAYGTLRERVLDFFDHPRSSPHVFLGFCALLSAASIFLSLSRGGILSTLVSLTVFSLLLVLRPGERKRAVGMLVFLTAAMLCVGAVGWDPILSRFERIRTAQGEIADQRLEYWRDSVPLLSDFTLTGTGLGTYAEIYPYYQKVRTYPRIVDHAHNDYIELVSDAGLAGLGLTGWFWASVLVSSFKAWRRRKGSSAAYLFYAGICGLLAIALHSLTDFNLYIGANGLYLFFIAALIVAAGHTRSGRGQGITDLKVLGRAGTWGCAAAAVLLLAWTLAWRGGQWMAQGRFSPAALVDLGTVEMTRLPEFARLAGEAGALAPLNSYYRFAAGDFAFAANRLDDARSRYAQALRLRPLSGPLLERAAVLESVAGRQETADALLTNGQRAFTAQPERGRAWALRLLDTGRRDEALAWVRGVLQQDPAQTRDYLQLSMKHGMAEAFAAALPEKSEAWRLYAAELGKGQGAQDRMEAAYSEALRLARQEKEVDRGLYWEALKFYGKAGREDEALETMRQAIERFPREAGFHAQAGNLYEKRGITYRAVEEYRQALLLGPDQEWVRKRLEKLEPRQ